MAPNLRGALIALASFAVFSTHDVVVKVVGAAYSPVQVIFFSVLFGFPLALAMLIRDRTPGTLRTRHPWWTLLRTAAMVLGMLGGFYAFTVLPLAQVYAIIFAAPLFVTVLSIPILGERVHLRRWAAVVVGLIGVLVVLRPGAVALSLGHLGALAGALGSAMGAVVVRKIGHDERPVVLMLYPMVASALIMGAALGFVYKPMPAPDLGLIAVLAVLGFTAARLFITAYSVGEAVIVAPMQYSQILWAALFGALFFDERIDTPTLLGSGIIIASGLYILWRERQTSQAGDTAP